jgi:4,5-dihydroxyphthalate decarboxylase
MASRLELVLGCADHDLNHPLIDGAVGSSDFALEVVWDLADGQRHRRMLRDGAFDACEFSFANYLGLWSEGPPFRGIPVFPNRKFRHSYVFCNRRAAIREPRDLEGKRVGMRGWANTASLWVRGILQRYYGVDLRRVTWCAPAEGFAVQLPAGISVERLPEDADLDRLLVAGDLDAVINPDVLPSLQRGAPEVHRLFEDYRAAEQDFYRQTRIFPISHLVVVKNEVVRDHPWAPLSLLHLFREARDACFQRIEDQQILALSWAGALLAEQRALMGAAYWPYNLADNRLVLDTLLDFAHEQGIVPVRPALETLFVPDTVGAPGA